MIIAEGSRLLSPRQGSKILKKSQWWEAGLILHSFIQNLKANQGTNPSLVVLIQVLCHTKSRTSKDHVSTKNKSSSQNKSTRITIETTDTIKTSLQECL
jgi:hypothetical protein